jgi:hypothetical protein
MSYALRLQPRRHQCPCQMAFFRPCLVWDSATRELEHERVKVEAVSIRPRVLKLDQLKGVIEPNTYRKRPIRPRVDRERRH